MQNGEFPFMVRSSDKKYNNDIGKSPHEWEKLAQWFTEFKVCSHFVRWMIQIPRLYSVYKKAGVIKNFQEMLDNLFKPLFEVTLKPETNPDLYRLLFQVYFQ